MWSNLFAREHVPIDVIISPEIEVARAVTRRLQVPGAFEMIPLVEDRVKLVGVRCGENCPLINTPLRQLTQLFPDLNIVIVGLTRQNRAIVPTGDDQMLVGDEAYFVVDSDQLPRAMAAFGYEEPEGRRLLICGGAMRMQGSGVLALGRAMHGSTAAKHRIKRVDRFLGNAQVEVDGVSEALFRQFRPATGRVVVLADWTDRGAFQQ